MDTETSKTILSFISRVTINLPKGKIIDEVVVDMIPIIRYRVNDCKHFETIESTEFIESQTLNVVQLDKENNVVSSNNSNGEICCAYSSKPFCLCNDCKLLRQTCKCTECRIMKCKETTEFVLNSEFGKENIKVVRAEEVIATSSAEPFDDMPIDLTLDNDDDEVIATFLMQKPFDDTLIIPKEEMLTPEQKTVSDDMVKMQRKVHFADDVHPNKTIPMWKRKQDYKRKMKIPLRRSERIAAKLSGF